jgi:hypothetical protein
LGFTITSTDDITEINFKTAIEKLRSMIRHWNMFKLSLKGRLSVYKSLLIPQVNYIATILTPSPQLMDEINTLLECFVTTGLKVSKDRWYTPPCTRWVRDVQSRHLYTGTAG